MLDVILQPLWPALLLWFVLYLSDFVLTLAGARLYRQGAHRHMLHEGGYELEPYYRRDVANGKTWSWRFLWAALWGALFLTFLAAVAKMAGVPEAVEFFVGMYLLPEIAIHVRHVKNLWTYRQIRDSGGCSGTISYTMAFSLRLSAGDFVAYALLFAALGALTPRWLFAGGVFGCLNIARRDRRLARREEQGKPPESE